MNDVAHLPIDLIRLEVANYTGKVLDQTVALDSDLRMIIFSDFFMDKQQFEEATYKDILVKNIIALGRSDGWKGDTQTWKELINTWIIGDTWHESIFAYFEGSIEDKNFPAVSSSESLKMTSYSGLLVCNNGNHRLVGACCWMACKHGDNAQLKQVSTSYIPLKKAIKEFIFTLESDDKVYIYGLEKGQDKYIKVTNNDKNYIKFYHLISDSQLQLIGAVQERYCRLSFVNRYFVNRYLKKQGLLELHQCNWIFIDNRYINIWLDEITQTKKRLI